MRRDLKEVVVVAAVSAAVSTVAASIIAHFITKASEQRQTQQNQSLLAWLQSVPGLQVPATKIGPQ